MICYIGTLRNRPMKYWQKINKYLLTKEVFLYLLVGALGAVLDFGSFYYLRQHLPPLYAQWLAAFIGFTHNHVWQHFKVFEHNQTLEKTYSISLIISVISIVISGPAMVGLISLGMNIWLAKVVVLAVTTIVLYFVRKRIVFRMT
jgi:putative flippase GtrA